MTEHNFTTSFIQVSGSQDKGVFFYTRGHKNIFLGVAIFIHR